MAKQTVYKEIGRLSLYDLEGQIEDVIETLREQVSPGTSLSLNSDYDDCQYLAIIEERLETDAEESARIQREENYKKWVEEKDKKEFARLKAKYDQS